MSTPQVDARQTFTEQVARGVRRLCEEDVAQAIDLLEQLGYPQTGSDVERRIRRWADGDDDAAFVWDERGTLLGVIAAHVVPSFEKDGSWLRIVALVVHDAARGRGIGTSLVAAAEEFGHRKGCASVEVTTARARENARAFYRALGYRDRTEDAIRFNRDLPG